MSYRQKTDKKTFSLDCPHQIMYLSNFRIWYAKLSIMNYIPTKLQAQVVPEILAFEKLLGRAGPCHIIDWFYVKKKNFGTNPTSLYDDF